MNKVLKFFLAATIITLGIITKTKGQNIIPTILETMDYAKLQVDKTLDADISVSRYPRRNYPGDKWSTMYYRDWTSGFWPGCLWLMYQWTGNDTYLQNAKSWTSNLEANKNDVSTHDVGFQIMCSFGNGNHLKPSQSYSNIIINAAQSLASRFNEKMESIISWDTASWHGFQNPVIVDNMMNLELLFEATKLSGDSTYHKIAIRHALRTIETHQRANGTFNHIVDYDALGNVIYTGMSSSWPSEIADKIWSRGQGWALYGFTMAYRYSKNNECLSAAEKLADFLIDSITPGYVPYYIMDYPQNPNMDASAAAILFSGLLELYGFTKKTEYQELAENIFSALSEPPYLTKDQSYYSILALCAENYTDQQKGLIYADYYFIEGMLRYLELFKGKEYYCDPVSGSISNPGTLNSPWNTLEDVFDAGKILNPGDIIYLRNGYHGALTISGNNSSYITIRAQDGHSPTLSTIAFNNASYWNVSGVTISPEIIGEYVDSGNDKIVNIHSSSSYITIDSCYVYNAADVTGWDAKTVLARFGRGIYCDAPNCEIINNHVKNTRYSIVAHHNATSTVVRNNLIEDISEDGIRCIANYLVVENNVLRNWYGLNDDHDDGFQAWTGGHDGIPVGGETKYGGIIRGNTVISTLPGNPFPPTYGTQGIGWFDGMFEGYIIENNLICTNMWHGIAFYGAINCKIINNTVVKNPYQTLPGVPWIKITAHKNGTPSSGNIIRNNLTTTLSNDDNIGEVDHNIITSDYTKYFIDYEGLDFHLKATSTAIDAGSSADAPLIDNEGLQRPQGSGFDVGAFEYSGMNIDVSGISLSETDITLNVEESFELNTIFSPSNATIRRVTWASSDENVVHINESGKITALSKGTTTITVKTVDGGFTAECAVTVNPSTGEYNVALLKSVTVSDEDVPATPGSNLVDGDISAEARWSAIGRPQSARIDLGDNYDISRIELYTLENRAYQYTIEAKTDDGSYVTIVDRSANTEGAQPLTDVVSATARYIKISVTGLVNHSSSWVSLVELKVFGLPSTSNPTTSGKYIEETVFRIHPNPGNGLFTIDFSGYNTDTASVLRIFDLAGKKVYSENIFVGNKVVEKMNVNLAALQKGVYMVVLTIDKTDYKRKLIIR